MGGALFVSPLAMQRIRDSFHFTGMSIGIPEYLLIFIKYFGFELICYFVEWRAVRSLRYHLMLFTRLRCVTMRDGQSTCTLPNIVSNNDESRSLYMDSYRTRWWHG